MCEASRCSGYIPLSRAAFGRPLMINSVSRRGHRQILLATFSQLMSPFQATRRRNLRLKLAQVRPRSCTSAAGRTHNPSIPRPVDHTRVDDLRATARLVIPVVGRAESAFRASCASCVSSHFVIGGRPGPDPGGRRRRCRAGAACRIWGAGGPGPESRCGVCGQGVTLGLATGEKRSPCAAEIAW